MPTEDQYINEYLMKEGGMQNYMYEQSLPPPSISSVSFVLYFPAHLIVWKVVNACVGMMDEVWIFDRLHNPAHLLFFTNTLLE